MTDIRPSYLLDTTVGVIVSGTIGILLKGVTTGVLTLPEADGLLAEMIRHSYRAPVHSLRELLID